MMIRSFYQLGIITRFIVLIYLVCSVKFRLLYHKIKPNRADDLYLLSILVFLGVLNNKPDVKVEDIIKNGMSSKNQQ